jgi:tetratricopeptide (TPR) repeat protein
MSETIRCPGCGRDNPAGSESCSGCNFPLASEPAPAGKAPGAAPTAPAGADDSGPVIVRRMRPVRPRRPQPANSMSVALWLLFGTFCAVVVVVVAIQGYNKNNVAPAVEGSSPDQQKAADQLRATLERDSTNIQARVELANLLYDTGNWSEAIVHYRSALAMDSTQIHVIVDMGVCYFNLSATREAENLFQLALRRDKNQAVALFNLGIVNQQRGDHKAALGYFHRALVSGPPQEMKTALMDAMKRSYDATGAKAKPLPEMK